MNLTRTSAKCKAERESRFRKGLKTEEADLGKGRRRRKQSSERTEDGGNRVRKGLKMEEAELGQA